MRFIVDESTGMAVVGHLRGAGHDVLAVGESMPKASDRQILARAVSEKRILITNDKDFGEWKFERMEGWETIRNAGLRTTDIKGGHKRLDGRPGTGDFDW